MPKKPRVRTVMDNQHVKVSERLLKSESQHFCRLFDDSEEKSATICLF